MLLHVGQPYHIIVPADFLYRFIKCRELILNYPPLQGITQQSGVAWLSSVKVNLKTAVGRKNLERPQLCDNCLGPQSRRRHTHPVGAALSVDVLKNSLVQTQLQAGLVKHFSLIGVPSNEAIHLHSLTLAYPVTTGLSLRRRRVTYVMSPDTMAVAWRLGKCLNSMCYKWSNLAVMSHRTDLGTKFTQMSAVLSRSLVRVTHYLLSDCHVPGSSTEKNTVHSPPWLVTFVEALNPRHCPALLGNASELVAPLFNFLSFYYRKCRTQT